MKESFFIDSIDIKEFRGIKVCEHPIPLTDFTILIGRNNSGKSTILEALSLLPTPKSVDYIIQKSKIEFINDLHRQFKGKTKYQKSKVPIHYKSLLYLYAGTSTLQYQKKGLNEKYTIRISKDEYKFGFIKISKLIDDENLKQVEFISEDFNQIVDFLNIKDLDTSSLVLFIPYDTDYLNYLEARMSDLKESIIKKGIHIDVAKTLNKCVDDEYSEILFGKPMQIRKIINDNVVYISLNDLGSGAEKMIKFMTLIETMNPKLILIDDIEAAFHPSMLNIILKWLAKRNCQIVLSTHSIDVLYRLSEIEPNNGSALYLKKSKDDVLTFSKLTLNEIEDFLNSNTDPRLLNLKM